MDTLTDPDATAAHPARRPGAPAPGPSARLARVTRITRVVVMAAITVFVVWRCAPGEVLRNTVPTGGDLGAHVWGPAYLRDHLLPLRLSGWAPDWFAGFPAYRFYMVLPALAVAALGLVLPYGVALKLVVVSGVVALPWCAWGCVRLMYAEPTGPAAGHGFPAPELAALAMVPFLFDTSYAIYGGNLASTLAGEYSYAISLCFALAAIGVAARGLANGRHRAALAILLAGCALSHVIPAFFAAAGVLVVLAFRADRSRVRWLVPVAATAAALSAFWLLPFVGRHAWFNDMGWVKRHDYWAALFTPQMRLAVPVALIGVVSGFVDRRRAPLQLGALALVVALAFVALPPAALWNARLLPFFYCSVWMLAGIGLAAMLRWCADLARESDLGALAASLRPAGALLTTALVLLAVAGPLGVLPAWVPFAPAAPSQSWLAYGPRGSFAGYERQAGWPRYRAFVTAMDEIGREHGCGRAMWEFSQDLGRYGTTMAPMLLPYWTDGCIGSMEGLYFESSRTTPFHFLNQARLSATPSSPQRDLPYRPLDVGVGVGQLQLEGVRYYLASSPRAQAQADANPDLTWLTTVDEGGRAAWKVYEVRGSETVVAPGALPAVYDGPRSWRAAAMEWFQTPSAWPVPLAQDGPRDWPRTPTIHAPATPVAPTHVSEVRTTRDSVSFRVDTVGTPVIVRVSAFPGWTVQGARGPWVTAPNMMVVVPTDKKVTLRFGVTPLDVGANAITVAGWAGVAWFALAPVPALVRRRGWWRGDDDDDEDDAEDES